MPHAPRKYWWSIPSELGDYTEIKIHIPLDKALFIDYSIT